MNTGIKTDIVRLLLILGIALIAGIVFDQILLSCCIALLITILWYFKGLTGLLNYIRYNAEDNLPEMPGILDELTSGFDQVRNDYRQRELKLADMISRYEETTAALPDAVVVTSEGGVIEWANMKAAVYLGVNWPMDRGQRLSNLIRSPQLQQYLQQQTDRNNPEVLELVSPEDQDLMIELRAIRYGNSFMLLVARDITEFQHINRVRKDFIANASHELRTPLTVIAGYLEAFEEDPDCPEDWLAKITQMRQQAGRMQRLIEDLLELSRLESAKKVEHPDAVYIAGMLETILKEAEILSGDQQHVLVKELDHNLHLHGVQHDLYKAFSNLVFNAVQYTPAHGRITVRWYQDKNGAHLAVEDTGEGIDEKHLSRITERFYRVDKGRSRAHGGTGLGLAIVKHVLSQYQGRLHIKSIPGEGSVFRCDFPAELCFVQQLPDKQVGNS